MTKCMLYTYLHLLWYDNFYEKNSLKLNNESCMHYCFHTFFNVTSSPSNRAQVYKITKIKLQYTTFDYSLKLTAKFMKYV